MMYHFLYREYFHNSVLTWATVTATVAAIIGGIHFLKCAIVSRLKDVVAHTPGMWDDIVLDIARRTLLLFELAMAAAAAAALLDLPHRWDHRLHTAVLVIAILQVAWWGTGIVQFIVSGIIDRYSEGGTVANQTGKNVLRFLGLTLVWTATTLLVLENLGVNVTGLVAGLGVTGVAVALATQNIVGDLFASVSLLLDRPFLVGDFIVLDTFMGSVERIGIKTTRLRSLGGELIIVANSDLTKSRVRNYKNMSERRVLFSFTVAYDTSHEKLAAVPAMVRDSIENLPRTRFDRAELLAFSDTGLQYEVVYYVLDPGYNVYTELQHQLNLQIIKRLQNAGVALGTRTSVTYSPPWEASPFMSSRSTPVA
jgi:small-conductance mechanosensitive channel